MTSSAELANVAFWMMVIGGVVGAFGLVAILYSTMDVNRGDMAKPLTIVGLGMFLLGAFLKYRWGTYW
ncbi:MAG: hypothetical protein E2O90_09100 [Alphaproteobacteria bacterium]|nr:MAG: hypothetical protein E2O90_09100 [Alphaproteobacteria bacterium]